MVPDVIIKYIQRKECIYEIYSDININRDYICTQSSDINEIYRNSLRSFLYIGAAGFALDILRSLRELRISAGLRFRYATPKGCASRPLRKPAAPLYAIGLRRIKEGRRFKSWQN